MATERRSLNHWKPFSIKTQRQVPQRTFTNQQKASYIPRIDMEPWQTFASIIPTKTTLVFNMRLVPVLKSTVELTALPRQMLNSI